MQLEAPAKINLSFRILGRRADGFHAIETLMAPVSLCDTLTITRAGAGGEIKLVCDDPTLATGDDNLVVKAARLFLREARIDAGISLDLRKRIPHGAGLGGGSSDAAATLTGLNRMFDGRFSQDELQRVAAQLGSDVPFFIGGTAAKCSGRGEIVQPVSLGQALPLLLLKPGFGVSTPWAYSRWVESAELPGIDLRAAGIRRVLGRERSGAAGLRETSVSGGPEELASPAAGSRGGADVWLGINHVRGVA